MNGGAPIRLTPRYLAATGMPVAWRSVGMTSFAINAIERCQSALSSQSRPLSASVPNVGVAGFATPALAKKTHKGLL